MIEGGTNGRPRGDFTAGWYKHKVAQVCVRISATLREITGSTASMQFLFLLRYYYIQVSSSQQKGIADQYARRGYALCNQSYRYVHDFQLT